MNYYSSLGDHDGIRAFLWDASGTMVELNHLGTSSNGETYVYPNSMNAAGVIAGMAATWNGTQFQGYLAVRWNTAGDVTVLANLGTDPSGSTTTTVFDMNAAGQIVGTARRYNDAGVMRGARAVRWNSDGTILELEHLGTQDGTDDGFTNSAAYAINDAGISVGYASVNGGPELHAVRWDASGKATELGSLGVDSDGKFGAIARLINASGTAAGMADKYDSLTQYAGTRAVVWLAGETVPIELEVLGADAQGVAMSEVTDINDAGMVVGRAQKWTDSPLDQGWRPVRWNASGQVQELGILGTNFFGMTDGAASGLNSDGIAVGFLSEFDGLGNFIDFRAVAWGLDGNPIVLNSLLSPADAEHWVNLIEAWDISDSYWISGMGLYDPDGAGPLEPYERPFLLNAAELMISSVPEPAGVALLALAAPLLLRRRSSV